MDKYEKHCQDSFRKKNLTLTRLKSKEHQCADFMWHLSGSDCVIVEVTSIGPDGRVEVAIKNAFEKKEVAIWDVQDPRFRRKIINKSPQIESTRVLHGLELPSVLLLYDGRPPITSNQARAPEQWLREIACGMFGKTTIVVNIPEQKTVGEYFSGKTDLCEIAKGISAVGTFVDKEGLDDVLVLFANPYTTHPLPIDALRKFIPNIDLRVVEESKVKVGL